MSRFWSCGDVWIFGFPFFYQFCVRVFEERSGAVCFDDFGMTFAPELLPELVTGGFDLDDS